MLDERLLGVVAGALLGGALLAKLSVVWRYVLRDPDPTLAGVLIDGGKSLVGGLAGAYVGALVAKRLVGYRGHTGDVFASAVALGIAVGRVGCFLTEEPGTPTSLPWGVHVSSEAAARIPDCEGCVVGVAMHPSFLYEIAFLLAMFALLLWLRSRIGVPGELFKILLFGYAVFRFFVEFVRGNEVVWSGLSGTQLFLIPSTLALGVYFARQITRGAYRARSGAMMQRAAA